MAIEASEAALWLRTQYAAKHSEQHHATALTLTLADMDAMIVAFIVLNWHLGNGRCAQSTECGTVGHTPGSPATTALPWPRTILAHQLSQARPGTSSVAHARSGQD